MNARQALRRARVGRAASAVVVLLLAGGVTVATGAIPDSDDGEVHLCYAPTGEVRVIDAQQGLGCPGRLTKELVINQKGPKGDQGPAGQKGDPGTSDAYFEKGEASLVGAARDGTVSEAVPAGSYAISATARLANDDFDTDTFADCRLQAGASVIDQHVVILDARTSPIGGKTPSVGLQGVAPNFAGGAVSITCSKSQFQPASRVRFNAVLTAIKVSSVH